MKWSIGIFLFAVVANAEPQQVKLEWGHSWTSHYEGGAAKAYRDAPDDCDPLDGDDVRYVEFPLTEERTLTVALQLNHRPPRVWVDLNFDGQLTDEKPLGLTSDSSRFYASFQIGWRDAKGAEPHPLPMRLSMERDLGDGEVKLRISAHRQAQAVIGGRLRRIVAVSGGFDLRVDDAETDRIYVDLDGDGKLTNVKNSHERITPGKSFRAGKTAYVLELEDATGATVKITKAKSAPPLRPRPWPAPRRAPYYSFARTTYSTSRSLKELMRDCDKEIREYAPNTAFGIPWEVRGIACVGTASAVKFLVRAAKGTKHEEIRNAITEALGNRRSRPHAKIVMAAARSTRDGSLAAGFLRALDSMEAKGRHEFFLGRLEADKRAEVQRTAATLVASAGPARNRELCELVGKTRVPAAEFFAYEAATRYWLAAPTAELLLTALKSKDARLRLLALKDTAWLGLRDTSAEISAIAQAEIERKRIDPELARLVIQTLGPMAGPTEIPLLLAVVPHASRKMRKTLVELLAPVRDAAVSALVREQLGSRNELVRQVAARVLIEFPEVENGPAMAARLAVERNPDVRASLVVGLGRRKEKSAAAALIVIIRKEKKDDKLLESAMAALARIGLTAPEAAEFFKRESESGTWTRRLDATDALARYGDESAVPFLASRLQDSDWRIRAAAVQGLGRIRSKDGIGPLIDRLETEKHAHTRRTIADALFRITGESLYDIHKLWVKWWVLNATSFRVPAIVPKKKRSKGERRTVAEFYGVPVESDKVVFVIDQSGSMGGFGGGFGRGSVPGFGRGRGGDENDLDRAVKQTINVVKRLKDGAMVNVIFFESSIHAWSKKLVKLSKKSRARLEKHLLKQKPTGGTNLYDGLELALKMRGVEVIYLLSDGVPGSGRFVEDEDILREIGKRNRRLRVQIHCISIGRDSDLLKKLAEQTGGTYAKQ